MARWKWATAPVALALAVSGCADSRQMEGDTSLGEWTVAAEPILTIGGADDRADYRVSGAARLSNGRVVIANGGSSELKYFDRQGDDLS